jgi:hypothetical protein
MTALAAVALGCKGPPPTSTGAITNEPNRLYWGDTHVHTSHSAYAYLLGNRSADPDTAYRWAKGLPVVHPHTGAKVQIHTPLDFLVVADHAEMLAVPLKLMQGDPKLASTETGKRWIRMMQEGKGPQIFEQELSAAIRSGTAIGGFDDDEVEQSAWGSIVEAAEKHYAPCSFTSFVGWEWTATPDGKSLHRVVFMDKGREQASQFIPFSSFDSPRPEDLWGWLEETSARAGTDFIAIPHNSNLSGGMMYPEVDSDGRPITAAYARTRMRWEPIVEVAQIEGDSETHPSLSPDDELADFEKLPQTPEAGGVEAKASEGDYVRSGLLRGLQIDQEIGSNPYKVGMIASTGSYTGLASAEEFNFWGRTAFDSIPENKSAPGSSGLKGSDVSAQGLAAVWAEENTRTSIFAAFKRKEVYATTGPRIRVRFFGGWDFDAKQAQKANMVTVGYTFGHPMGSDLTKVPKGKKPTFLFYAVKDPEGANLDRIQLIKGWVDAEGKTHEKVYDVAWSGGRKRGPDGKVPPIDSTVHLATAKYDNVWGAPALRGFWSDPDFDPKERAFYYLRVLEIPTPRHTLYDAVALGTDPNESGRPPTIQERAYTSPIWYTP